LSHREALLRKYADAVVSSNVNLLKLDLRRYVCERIAPAGL